MASFLDDIYIYTNMKTPMNIISIPIRIVGVLGNLLNIVVLSHKKMASPINSILWWLAVSDIFELVSIELVDWYNDWSPMMDFILLNSLSLKRSVSDYNVALLWKLGIYLLQVFHTITIALNIILADWRYHAVAHPLQSLRRGDRAARKPVLIMYVLGFIICSPLLYVVKIKEKYHIVKGIVYTINYPWLGLKKRHVYHLSNGQLIFLAYAFILRVVPLVLLTVISVKFIFVLLRTRRDRRDLSASGQDRTTHRINILIMGIVLMFAITDIPISVSPAFMIMRYLQSTGYINELNIPKSLQICILLQILLPKLTLAINCSYNMFFYLMMSIEYRKTLKFLLSNVGNRLFHFRKRRMTTQRTDIVMSDLHSGAIEIL